VIKYYVCKHIISNCDMYVHLEKPNFKQILLNRSFGNNTLLVLGNDDVTSETVLYDDYMNWS